MFGRLILILATTGFLAIGCVQNSDPAANSGWLYLTPNTALDMTLADTSGSLSDITIQIPAASVEAATYIRLTVPSSEESIFVDMGLQLRTPALLIEPQNQSFQNDVTLQLPWSTLGDDPEPTDEEVQIFYAPTLSALEEGLWDEVDTFISLGQKLTFTITSGGYYWAGTWEVNADRTPDTTFGEICTIEDRVPDSCDSDVECVVSGCLGEICGNVAQATVCRQSSESVDRLNCACTCSAGRCQWIQ